MRHSIQSSSRCNTAQCHQTATTSRSHQYSSAPLLPPRPDIARSYDSQQTSNLQKTTESAARNNDVSSRQPAEPNPHKRERRRLERDQSAIARGLEREAAKQKVKQFKKDRKQKLKEEKARKRWLGGVAWGFDPTAGMTSYDELNKANEGCYVSTGRSAQGLEGVDEIDELGRRTGRRWVSHNLWGIEHGGPGNEGKYRHGSLRDRVTGAAATFVKKPRSLSLWR